MPKALGEFGKARNSSAVAAILDALQRVHEPQTINQLWKIVNKDLNKFTELSEILLGLMKADKIQVIKIAGKQGYLAKHIVTEQWAEELLDLDYLAEGEMD